MQLAEELVLLAGSQTLVGDRVVEDDMLGNLLLMRLGGVALERGVDLNDVDRLVLIGDIGVARDVDAVA